MRRVLHTGIVEIKHIKQVKERMQLNKVGVVLRDPSNVSRFGTTPASD